MTIAHWTDEYCTGDTRIDQEHQTLFQMVNALHAAIESSSERSVLRDILTTMAQHTVEHFEHEESLMLAYGYPGFSRHRQVHANLTAKVTALLEKLDQQEAALSSAITEFLTDWLSHHIRGEDQKMIQFLQQQEGQTAQSAIPAG